MPHETYFTRIRKVGDSIKIDKKVRKKLDLKPEQYVKVTIETEV
jgi:hypothetical protein